MGGYIMDLRKYVGKMPLIQVGASVILINDRGEILLQKRKDNGLWAYHGGSLEPGENCEEAAAREMREETGYAVAVGRFAALFEEICDDPAYRAEAHALALQLTEHCMRKEQRETLANAVVSNDDYDFLSELAPHLTPEYFGRLCVARAQDKNWDAVSRFAAQADHAAVEQMMELAIAEGNFDAIDMLDPLL